MNEIISLTVLAVTESGMLEISEACFCVIDGELCCPHGETPFRLEPDGELLGWGELDGSAVDVYNDCDIRGWVIPLSTLRAAGVNI